MQWLRVLADAIHINPNEVNLPNVSLSTGVSDIIQTMIFIAGSLSIIFVVVGGFMFVLSGGDPGKVKTARETIIYAIVGMIISIAAYAIVQFVLHKIS